MDAATSLAALRGSDDSESVALMRSQQSSAFVAVMRRNNQRLYRLARGILKDEAEAEEALQESYLRAFTHLDGFKGDSSLATWLARIVLHEALTRLRRRRPSVAIDEVGELLPVEASLGSREEPTPEQRVAGLEIRRAVEKAVDGLPTAFRAVFILRAIEQMSVEEAAAWLGIPADIVKTRFHRANRLLRLALSDQFGSLLKGAFPFLGARCDGLIASVLERLSLGAGADS
jgi:RNA polymerase sigma-70 factor, ECF subfamily